MAYLDETGIDCNAPLVVMVGVVANTAHLARSQEEFGDIFDLLTGVVPNLRELKSSDLLRGTGKWRSSVISNEARLGVINRLCRWPAERHHSLALAAIPHDACKAKPPAAKELAHPWRAAAWHVALQLQRAHQGQPKNKGRTILVFDDNKMHVGQSGASLWARTQSEPRRDNDASTAQVLASTHDQ